MKPYADYFDPIGMALAGVVIFLSLPIVWRVVGTFSVSVRDKSMASICFLFLCLFCFFNALTGVLPHFPDTDLFAQIVEQNNNESESLGVQLYMIISWPLRLAAFKHLEVYLVYQQLIFMLAAVFMWKAWLLHCKVHKANPGAFELFIVLCCVYPSTLSFITIPLREFVQILGFSIFIFGIVKFHYQRKISWLLIGALVTIFVRPQLILVYPFLYIVYKQKNLLKLSLYGIALLPVAALLFSAIGYKFKLAWFAYVRNAGVRNYQESGMTYGAVEWNTYFDMLLDVPLLFAQFVLSPLPILHDVSPFSLLLLTVDLMFVLLILFGAISLKTHLSSSLWRVFLFCAGVFCIWEFYIGGAVRHRMPLVLMLIPLATCYFSHVLQTNMQKSAGVSVNSFLWFKKSSKT